MDWPTCPGKVISSSVKQERDEGNTYYHAEVVYEFKVNNITYSGKRIAYYTTNLLASSDPYPEQQIVNRYPQDKNVTVHYMPNNPKKCVLEVGAKGSTYCMPAVGLFLVIIGLTLFIVGIVKK